MGSSEDLNRHLPESTIRPFPQLQIQAELPPKGPFRGRLVIQLNVGPGGANGYTLDLRCDP
jgi:hypothetical protein